MGLKEAVLRPLSRGRARSRGRQGRSNDGAEKGQQDPLNGSNNPQTDPQHQQPLLLRRFPSLERRQRYSRALSASDADAVTSGTASLSSPMVSVDPTEDPNATFSLNSSAPPPPSSSPMSLRTLTLGKKIAKKIPSPICSKKIQEVFCKDEPFRNERPGPTTTTTNDNSKQGRNQETQTHKQPNTCAPFNDFVEEKKDDDIENAADEIGSIVEPDFLEAYYTDADSDSDDPSRAANPSHHHCAVINKSRATAMPTTLVLTEQRNDLYSVGSDMSDSDAENRSERIVIGKTDSRSPKQSLEDKKPLGEGFGSPASQRKRNETHNSFTGACVFSAGNDEEDAFSAFEAGTVDTELQKALSTPIALVRAQSADVIRSRASPRKHKGHVRSGRTKSSIVRENFSKSTPLQNKKKVSDLLPIRSIDIVSSSNKNNNNNNNERDTQSSPDSVSCISNTDSIQHPICSLWMQRVHSAVTHHGEEHSQTADSWLDLGIAQLQVRAYSDSIRSLKTAVAIYRLTTKRSQNLALARALHHLGMGSHKAATTGCSSSSLVCFGEALRIRHEELGALHPDTVATLNCLGGVHMAARNYNEARRAYLEVLTVREAVFGIYHPSVAVAAHSLANASHHLGNLDEAILYYCKALDVYEALELHQDHPSLMRLLRDMNRIQRLRET